MAKKKRRLKSKSKIIFLLIILLAVFIVFFVKKPQDIKNGANNRLIKYVLNEQKRIEKINKCLSSSEVADEVKEEMVPKEEELYKYLKSLNIGFKYQEKTLDYELDYNKDQVFYGASLIKLLDADYLLDNNIDLSKTKKYEEEYVKAFSDKMAKRKIGEDVTLKDLMNYAISVSDNTAHIMLIDYIGFKELQDYGKSIGGKVTLQGTDKFGNQTADDMIVYLNKAYDLINNHENGSLLKEAMLNTEVNYLNFDDVVFGHKYGSWSIYFHDVGIYFGDKPYLIAVLTTSDKNKKVVTEVSKKVYDIHNTLIDKKESYCKGLK